MNLQVIVKEAQRHTTKLIQTMARKSPTLLTGVGAIGVVVVAVTTHLSTKKAVKKMEEVRSQHGYQEPETMVGAVVEEARETWPCYISPAIAAVVTIVSIVQSNRINVKRIVLLTDAYRMSENLRKEYQEKVKEVFGENKESKVQAAIAQDRVNNDPYKDIPVYNTGQGECVFKDCFSGRRFTHDPEKMRQARNQFDAKLLDEDYASLNEWYYLIKLERIDPGDDYGFNIDTLGRRVMSGIQFIPVMDENDRPITMVQYNVELNFDMFEPH